jgi:flavin-dependent dehydrogenase
MKPPKVAPKILFFHTSGRPPTRAPRLRDAKLTAPVTATGNYSYQVNLKRVVGRKYILIGDAFTFIDPVFSTGVMLAMQSGFTGADVVETCLDHPERSRAALKSFDRVMRRGPSIFSWFIYRMNTPAVRHLFMNPRLPFVQAGVLSMLAGDVFRDTPLTLRLLAFKVLYLMNNLFNPRRWLAWVRKHRVIVNEA